MIPSIFIDGKIYGIFIVMNKGKIERLMGER